MTPEIRAKITPDVVSQIIDVIGSTDETFALFGGFESFVYEWTRPEGSVFVKATWGGRRTRDQIAAEMAFVRHLAEGGASVAAPVRLAGEDVVTVQVEGGAFHLSATRQAPGRRVAKDELGAQHFGRYGALLARMHQVSRQPAVQALVGRRPPWEEEHAALEAFAGDDRILERYRGLLGQVRQLPRDPGVYGLVHTDAHLGNVYWDGTQPTAFDFDDCLGFWYASDLAIVLFYTLNAPPGSPDLGSVFRRNLAWLREGYEREASLPDAAWQTVPLFMDLREAVLYLVVERSVPVDARPDGFARVVAGRRQRLLQGLPALGLPG